MITAWPVVSARKCCRSSGRRHGSRFRSPMTPLAATAAISASGIGAGCRPRRSREFSGACIRRRLTGVIIAADYSGHARVLPPFVPQIHPARLPAGQPAARLRAGRADPFARAAAGAGAGGRAAGGAGRAHEPAAVRAGVDARAHRAPAPDPRGPGAARRLRPRAAGIPPDGARSSRCCRSSRRSWRRCRRSPTARSGCTSCSSRRNAASTCRRSSPTAMRGSPTARRRCSPRPTRLTERAIERLQETASQGRQKWLYLALATVGIALALAILFAVLIARPIRQLDLAIRQMGTADFTHAIEVNGPQDLRYLGQRLEWLRSRLRELEEQQNRFLRHVSHELKTPLTAVREGAELLRDHVGGELSPEQQEIVRIVRENTLSLQKLIEDLLTYHQTRALEPQAIGPVALPDIVRRVVREHKLAALARMVTIEAQLAAGAGRRRCATGSARSSTTSSRTRSSTRRAPASSRSHLAQDAGFARARRGRQGPRRRSRRARADLRIVLSGQAADGGPGEGIGARARDRARVRARARRPDRGAGSSRRASAARTSACGCRSPPRRTRRTAMSAIAGRAGDAPQRRSRGADEDPRSRRALIAALVLPAARPRRRSSPTNTTTGRDRRADADGRSTRRSSRWSRRPEPAVAGRAGPGRAELRARRRAAARGRASPAPAAALPAELSARSSR